MRLLCRIIPLARSVSLPSRGHHGNTAAKSLGCFHGNWLHKRGYHGTIDADTDDGLCVIDLRSDVLTKPSDSMKAAMMNATWDDDVLREDPTTNGNEIYKNLLY